MNKDNVKGKILIKDTTDLKPTVPAISQRLVKPDSKKHTDSKKTLKL